MEKSKLKVKVNFLLSFRIMNFVGVEVEVTQRLFTFIQTKTGHV